MTYVPALLRKTQPLPMPAGPGLSKLSSVRENNVEVDVILGELNNRTESKLSINRFNAYRNEFPDSLERR